MRPPNHPHIPALTPPAGLGARIVLRIEHARRMQAVIAGACAAACGSVLAAAVLVLARGLRDAGFWDYLLLLTDAGAIASSWREYLLALTEAVPALPLAGSLLAAAGLMAAARRFTRHLPTTARPLSA